MMSSIVTTAPNATVSLPALFSPTADASRRFVEFFTANIRNPNTRKAYARAASQFATWCEEVGLTDLHDIEPVHVAAYVETLLTRLASPSVKLHLAGIRMLFDWLVIGQVIATNPASSVRGPKHSVKKGKTPVLTAEEARALIDSIDITTPMGLRDRALIGLMVYTFARVGAALKMKVEDVYVQGRRTWVRLHEKGGKQHEMPCHHNLDEYLHAYIDGAALIGAAKAPLFRSATPHTGQITERPMTQADVYRMIGRRALAAGIQTRIGCHSFRATGITEYLKNGGKLEVAQQMANHESARTTGLYDRRNDQVSLDEVERIVI
ncbi:tyrosine-type recombinase/integrase [Candidatus Accumulibacter phosphatis]|jgi:site-specific recombinase XerD|uniref:Site-specific recombinase XerC n=1 Tax=Candidatus Accumulibacter phosphatis TaxID=327160 RepID=A0A5S4EJI7_9PROT|nr:tyrosine-type recombinase/integrase [Candidatus Accumulibacter phosphatis]HMW86826.1 tyrosine-type recombinase/integrase [Nitrospira sp.]TMQ75518.1 Site-specific recombinase XerC [Candidatus Accumulibacter phosphatis]HNE34014.1 tyrosine-type recombinase/integrase [Nitrospira sp.]HNK49919.1 tyrosine-type recombinase/integrase [Nitrospira sp.]HNM18725.1 tyrosine-type recombinase/integrase [Nitrospira sp.]